MAVVDTEYEQNPQMLEREESEELDHLRSLSVARVRVTAERDREIKKASGGDRAKP